jgi:hypothetical protein
MLRTVAFLLVASAGLARANGWVTVDVPAPGLLVAAEPRAPLHLYFASAEGLFASADGGSTWTRRDRRLPDPAACPVQGMTFDAARPRTPLVGTGTRISDGRGCGAFRGRGRGRRWQSLGLDGEGVTAVASARGIVWAGSSGDGDAVSGLIQRRSRRGAWSTTRTFDDVDTDVTAIAVDPSNADRAVVATNNEGVLVTDDGGATWSVANAGLPRFDGSGVPSPSGAFVLAIPLVADPADPDTLYLGTLGYGSCCPDVPGVGGNVFVTHDRAASWTGGTGIVGANVLALVVDPVRAGTVYAGTTDGVFGSTDGGATWSSRGLTGAVVWSLAVAPDGSALYAASGELHSLQLAP